MECPIFRRDEGHLEETTNPRTHPLPHLKLKRRKKKILLKHMECPIFERIEGLTTKSKKGDEI